MARRPYEHTMQSIDNNPEEELDSPESIETGALAILDTSIRAPPQGLWERAPILNPSMRDVLKDGVTALRFEAVRASIMPPDGEDIKVKRYVIYELSVRLDTKEIDPFPATIERRYTDFRKLYLQLKRDHPNEMAKIDFPNKVLVGNFSLDLTEDRSDAFERFLGHVARTSALRDTPEFLNFLQDYELTKACQLLDERRNENAIPLLENSFRLLNKIFMDHSRPVLLILCRLVAASTASPVPHYAADRWANLALTRFDTLCDIDLLQLYIPLLHTCAILWWQRGRDQTPINDRLADMSKKGINITYSTTLMQAIHKLDPRAETI